MATDPRSSHRAAALLPEELAAGVEDPVAQAEVALADSDLRQLERDASPGAPVERRRSEETVEP